MRFVIDWLVGAAVWIGWAGGLAEGWWKRDGVEKRELGVKMGDERSGQKKGGCFFWGGGARVRIQISDGVFWAGDFSMVADRGEDGTDRFTLFPGTRLAFITES